AGVAAADEQLHETATLDRASGQSGAGADLSFVSDFDDGFVSRLDLHGQWMHRSGFGTYGQLAVSRAFLDDSATIEPIDTFALSNLEVGGQYRGALSSELSIVAHVGLTLPTAQNDGAAFLTNLVSSQRRFNDLVNAIPELTAIRLGVSPTWQRGAVFVRADLGLDVIVDHSDEMESSPDPIGHANLAIGARRGKLSGAAELVTVFSTGDVSEGAERFFHTGALSFRYDAGQVSPSLTIVTPLDDGARGDSVTVGAGVSAKF
ncbi:MAG: hypothetical protein H0V17_17460, partial [Deltaproteobacteria bacterium]|nr:hypothetical protein [Deltaproteobacteria bacterium]